MNKGQLCLEKILTAKNFLDCKDNLIVVGKVSTSPEHLNSFLLKSFFNGEYD